MILLVRHAQSKHNVDSSKVVGLVKDSPLTIVGRDQARQLGLKLKGSPPNIIYHSNTVRTLDTAKIIAAQLEVTPESIEDDRLLEMDKGELVGQLKLRTILSPKIFFQLLQNGRDFAFKNGETFNHVGQRMLSALEEIDSKHKNKNILVVTHGLAIRCLYGYKYNWSVWRIILTRARNAQVFNWPS